MSDDSLKIAVIGMAGRFPGADDIGTFWHNLKLGISGGKVLSQSDDGRVHYGFPLADADRFDADFFDVPAREAKMLDPQHRLFLECAYSAFEHAGIAPRSPRQVTGVFGGCNFNGYALRFANRILQANPLDLVDMLAANDKDYLAARVAYKLNLKGPALTVQCACSSSLAAVVTACQALLSGQCDVALAGGVGLKTSEGEGYSYEPEGPLSVDGHVRAYSDDASGVNEGEGVGAVVLKRLDDALRDGNVVYAVISGYAIGNDGADKTGFYAPSVTGQAAVIAEALAMSGVDPLEIGYVEGHGTGTPIGDPIEVAALVQAWQLPDTAPRQYCRLGSVKTGLGHLNAAAGVASLIKTVLALHHKIIPASLDFHAPNPRLSLETTPFSIAGHTADWEVAAGKTRKAAVNSLGIGGNNVHLILEEGPEPAVTTYSGAALITLSAKTKTALEKRAVELGAWLRKHPTPLADVAHTLLRGRDMQAFRLSLVCEDAAALSAMLESPGLLRKSARLDDPDKATPVAFLFPGFGSQHQGMAVNLRDTLPAFKQPFDRICATFDKETGIDVLAAISSAEALADTETGTFALFAVEYALARLLMDLGIMPSIVMGHSAGEYVAATIAGVFSEDDAVRLIVERSRLIGNSPEGGMLFVQMGHEDLRERLPGGVSIGAVITPDGCVASGSIQGIEALHAALSAENVPASRIAADRAGHSSLLEGAKPHLRKVLESVVLHRPRIRILSNVTGALLSDSEATDPDYWVRQMCEPVLLSNEIFTLCDTEQAVMLEVGPSRKLSAMLRRHPAFRDRPPLIPIMPSEQGKTSETAALLEALGLLWQGGGLADWERVDALCGNGRTVALPGYPFERKRFWLEGQDKDTAGKSAPGKGQISSLCWQQMLLPRQTAFNGLVGFIGNEGVGWAEALKKRGWSTAVFQTLDALKRGVTIPDVLVDCRFGGEGADCLDAAATVCRQAVELCSWLAESAGGRDLSVYWPTAGAAAFGTEIPHIDKSALLAPARVLPFEAKNTLGCVLDVEKGLSHEEMACILATAITHRLASTALTSLVAARSGAFWQETPMDIPLTGKAVSAMRLRQGAAYIVLGGSGGIGRTFMHELAAQADAQQCRITLVPVQRQPCPADFWEQVENDWAAVQPCSVDLNDHEAFMKAVDIVLEQYKKIGGIVHASGVAGGGLMQAQSSRVQDTENWNTKVFPLLGIEKILQHRNVDFVVLNSSIGALCGSVGQLDNTVANTLLDAWSSRQQAQTGTRILSLRWDVWRQVGMINRMASLHERLSGEELKGGITPDEAMRAFRACFAAGVATPVVSGRNLFSMLDESRARRGLATDALESADLKVEGAASQRPALAVQWKGARHVLDRVLIDLFESRLGLTGIGIDDDYVELGGDSLMAMPLAKEIRELLNLSSFSVAQIFRRRNVASIADALTESPEEKERLFALAELLENIKGMTPGEVSKSLEALS